VYCVVEEIEPGGLVQRKTNEDAGMDDVEEVNPLRRKLIAAKERWAREGRLITGQSDRQHRRRLPPGQHEVTDWPVLDLGIVPDLSLPDWTFSVSGLVNSPLRWTWNDFLAQTQVSMRLDLHCVTAWSRFGNDFTGVPALHLLDVVKPRAEARFLTLRSFDGYTTNLPLTDFADEDVLLAHSWQGQPISREHGGPMRLVVPKLYLWKSAKWLSHITFTNHDQPGYWELRGYHSHGDPWLEERYG
jgi:DMSO/TMAO reductase YedYZ molybdopterin-dependent catalytic subunit